MQASHIPGAGFAYALALFGVFVSGLYSFRLMFYAFHGEERFGAHDPHAHDGHDAEHHGPPHESPWVITLPLVLLAVPSVCAGWTLGSIVFGDYFGKAIAVSADHPVIEELAREFHGIVPMIAHAFTTVPLWLALGGAFVAWYLYIARPDLPAVVRQKAGVLVTILEEKYGFDRFNDWFFAGGARGLGRGLWQFGDVVLIDGLFVNGSARLVGWFSTIVRKLQSGYIYRYAFSMIFGVLLLLTWLYIKD